MSRDADWLGYILAAVAKINDRITDSFEVFQGDEMLQVWVIDYRAGHIGEAARGVSQPVKDRYPDVQWPQIIALRNILVHEYFGLNMHQVWTMTQQDLPKLEEQVNASATRPL
jgi:uncharacterized protein with HEPN domain